MTDDPNLELGRSFDIVTNGIGNDHPITQLPHVVLLFQFLEIYSLVEKLVLYLKLMLSKNTYIQVVADWYLMVPLPFVVLLLTLQLVDSSLTEPLWLRVLMHKQAQRRNILIL